MKPSDDPIEDLLAGLVPRTESETRPDPLDGPGECMTTREIAKAFGWSHERARQLVKDSKVGRRDRLGGWLVPRDWVRRYWRARKRVEARGEEIARFLGRRPDRIRFKYVRDEMLKDDGH